MSARADFILGRLPGHLDATVPGKQLCVVTDGLVADLDVLASDLAGVRRAHRVGHADTEVDLRRLGGLHGVVDDELAVLERRLAALPGGTGGYPLRLAALRERLVELAAIHAAGNGTIGALLRAAANALDLDVDHAANLALRARLQARAVTTLDFGITDAFFHSRDRFWHSTLVRDRLPPAEAPAADAPPELVGIEENPLRREERDLGVRAHAECFTVVRRGFGGRALRVSIDAAPEASACIGPVFVNRDEGRGFGFVGRVPQGETLTFTEEGRLTLGDADMTASGFSFEGAVFADADQPSTRDFRFGGPGVPARRRARFVETQPAAALDRQTTYPRAGTALAPLEIPLGVTRFAFFVQVAHLSAVHPAGVHPVTPRTFIGFAGGPGDHGGSVFGSRDPATPTPGARLGLSWREHQAHKLRVILPARFAALDPPTGPTTAALVGQALRRFRPAGVEVEVVYHDPRWVIGEGVLLEGGEGDPNLRLRGGTALGPAPVP